MKCKEKRCAEFCKLFDSFDESYTSKEFESFVSDVVVLFLTYVNKENINRISVLSFVRNNCSAFGFDIIYSDRIILDLINKFLEDK